MTDPALIERITRSLAFMLRHQPETFDLELDPYGYADLEDVVHALNERLGEPVEEEDVVDAVGSGDRPRYEIQGDRIRALYGHSIPVEPGPSSRPPETLFVAVPERELDRARRFGLRGGRRRFLHLAITLEDALESGRRSARDYAVLSIAALDAWEEGISFFDRQALWLAEEIPTHLIDVEGTYHDGRDPIGRGEGRPRGGRERDEGDDRGPRRGRRRGRRGGRDRDRDHEYRDRDHGHARELDAEPREREDEPRDWDDEPREHELDREPLQAREDRDAERTREEPPREERPERGRGEGRGSDRFRDRGRERGRDRDSRGHGRDRESRGHGRDRDRGRGRGRGDDRPRHGGDRERRRDDFPAERREERRDERRPERARPPTAGGPGFGAGLEGGGPRTPPPAVPRESAPAPAPRSEPARPRPGGGDGPAFGAGL